MSEIDEALEALGRLQNKAQAVPNIDWRNIVDDVNLVRQTIERQRVPSPDPRQRDGGLSEKQYRQREALERQRKPDGPMTTKIVDEYVDGYALEGDDGYYSPTERELLLIRDACHGLASELLDAPEVEYRLSQALERRRVPEGWKLVPDEPTESMYKAARTKFFIDSEYGPFYGDYGDIYRAMLAAAPEPSDGL